MKNTNRRFLGFSLVELLVVITIIGILASIAIPAYQIYNARVKFSIITNRINYLVDRSVIFASTKGRFGNCIDIGQASGTRTDSCDGTQGEKANLGLVNGNYYLTADGKTYTIGETSTPQCGKQGKFLLYQQSISTNFLPANIADTISLGCWYWNVRGTIQRECAYQTQVGGTNTTVNLAPGSTLWLNRDPTGSPSNATYSQATCT